MNLLGRTKNGKLTPYDVTPGSGLKVWWSCSQGQDHEWQTSVVHRKNGRGCPYCAGKKVSKDNNLAVKNPGLAKEWHPLKNGEQPFDVLPPSFENFHLRQPVDDGQASVDNPPQGRRAGMAGQAG